MKKRICMVLSLFILMIAFQSCGRRTWNEKLDAAFSSGDPGLMETESASVKPLASEFEFTDEARVFMKGSENAEDIDIALAEALVDKEFVLISKSPAGNSGLISDGQTLFTLYNGKYHFIYPSSKSVADVYSRFAEYYKKLMGNYRKILGEEGIVYSPDGRYAFIGNKYFTLQYLELIIDPVLLDLSTGELILTDTFPGDIMNSDQAGAVTTAVFSSDNKYFYYILFGKFGDDRMCLMRFNLSSGETETCVKSEKLLYLPQIAELKDGSILMLNDTNQGSESQSLMIAYCDDGNWTLKEETIRVEKNNYRASRLMYAPNTGLACCLGNSQDTERPAIAFQLVKPESNFDGIDKFWCITKETNEIVSLSPDEFRESVLAVAEDKVGKAHFSLVTPYQVIINAVFSPDGNYLLLHTLSRTEEKTSSKNLFLIRLKDMTLQRVSGLEAEKIKVATAGMDLPMSIEWNTDELIIDTYDGIKTFEFAAGK